MSLVQASDVKALIRTSATDAVLEDVIAREEAFVVRHCGPHYVDASTFATLTLAGGCKNLYLPQRPASVHALTEDDVTLVEDTDFRIWPAAARIERLPAGCTWGEVCVVEYLPADDREERKALIIELVRLALERTALQGESVAGEYSYQAPDWETQRMRLVRRLKRWEV